MRVRALSDANDWTYGKGQNNYKRNKDAVAQNIQTRLFSFIGDCYFDLGTGIDWFNFLGGKNNQVALNLAISAVILNTKYVTSLQQLSVAISAERKITIKYAVTTGVGPIVAAPTFSNLLATEDDDIITTESGIGIAT